MNKFLSLLLTAAVLTGCLTACSSDNGQTISVPDSFSKTGNGYSDGKVQIVTTIFPEYDWTKNILGDEASDAEVTMLLDSGVDLHSYQPSADDILTISECDVFVYIGGESEKWVDDVLKEARNSEMIVVDLMDVLGESVKEEEVVEGMQEEDEHEHDHDHEDEEHEEKEYDEHIWLSLKNASKCVDSIAEAIGKADPDNSDVYRKNADEYIAKIGALDTEYQSAVAAAPMKTLLFADRFPFRYMTDDYGLTYYAAFVGCSAETEASFETIAFLAGKVDELSLESVMTIDGTDHRIADTVINSTKKRNQKILTLNSMQSVTSKDIENGADYLSLMKENLETLKEALNA
ncbi:MAG: zinc ABC transporter substrate-binding protein [Oscillospiraceae bacterium]|nr:zinc ABC transporter substrate-binding protein [Oscillospiraceae bacterium]